MELQEYRQASHAIWEAMAPGWDARHAYFEQRSRAATERMLALLDPRPGQTLLELAAGTGIVGFAAARLVGPGGRVVVSDFSEAMVETARRHGESLGLENLEYRVLDAERLDLPDAAVDGVLCRWGYMLMADPAAAAAETRRVLRPGGRAACAVFAEAARNPWAALAAGVLVERGAMPPPGPDTPGIFALGDPGRLEALFSGSGFDRATVEEVAFDFAFEDLDDYWDFLDGAAGAISMVLRTLDGEEEGAVRDELGRRLERFAGDGGGYRLPAVCLVACAAVPQV